MYTLLGDNKHLFGNVIQGRKDAGSYGVCLFLPRRCTKDLCHSMDEWVVETMWEIGIRGKTLRIMVKNMAKCAISAVCDAARGKI